MSDNKGTIYGLVGVIGSGKSYRATQFQENSKAEGRSVIIGDFSDGIRSILMKILTGTDYHIDVNSDVYRCWKNNFQSFLLPFSIYPNPVPYAIGVRGRDLLQRTGEILKDIAGNDVWAKWTGKQITKIWTSLPDEDAYRANIVFGSVRFLEEVEVIFDIAKMTSKEVEIIFCNFKSGKYELNNHTSELLARHFVELGFKDGDDITEQLYEMLVDERIS